MKSKINKAKLKALYQMTKSSNTANKRKTTVILKCLNYWHGNGLYKAKYMFYCISIVNTCLNKNYLLLQVGTVTPVEDYLALVNRKDVDKFDEG